MRKQEIMRRLKEGAENIMEGNKVIYPDKQSGEVAGYTRYRLTPTGMDFFKRVKA